MRRLASICLLLICALLSGNATAGHIHGISPAVVQPGISQRAVVNMNTWQNPNEYSTINLIVSGANSASPYGLGWNSGTVWSSAVLDPKGWPCWNPASPPAGTTCTNTTGTSNPNTGKGFGGTWNLPVSNNYSGVYCVQILGSGNLNLNGNSSAVTFTAASAQTCANFDHGAVNCDGASHFTNSGTASLSTATVTSTDENWLWSCIAVTYSGAATGLGWEVTTDDPNQTGHYIKDVRIYQQSDGADLDGTGLCAPNPCIFRAAYKNIYLSYDPSYIRVGVNWAAASEVGDMDFTRRMTPLNAIGYSSNSGSFVTKFLPYQVSTGTNNYVVAGVTGTPTNMTHGEVANFIVGTQSTGAGYPSVTALSIPVAGTVQITTGGTFPFANGDTIVVCFNNCSPLNSTNKNLNWFPVTVATGGGTNTVTFLYANTASLTACSGNCGANAVEFYTLQVGSGSNRTAYPLVNNQGSAPYAIGTLKAPDSNGMEKATFCFNKNFVGQWDGAGNFGALGVWKTCGTNGIPLEIMTAFINELNMMSPPHPINMWYAVPPNALICNTFYCDADTTSTNEWAANAVNVIMNGANGYAGLTPSAQLIVEGGNELWGGSVGGSQDLAARGYYRYPACACPSDLYLMSTLWSSWVVYDIKQAAVYSSYGSRIHFARTGQAVAGSGGGNAESISGTGNVATYVLPDAAYPLGSSQPNAPILDYDYGFAVAPYLQTGSTTYNTNICSSGNVNPCTGSYGTIVTSWISDVQTANASGTANGFLGSSAIADLASWFGTSGLITTDAGQSSINSSITEMAALATLLSTGTTNNNGVAYNRPALNYEGISLNYGWGFPTTISAISCASGTATFTASNSYSASQSVVINDVSVAGYNTIVTVSATGLSSSGFQASYGGSCPTGGAPTVTYQGRLGYTTNVVNGFFLAGIYSTAWSNAVVAFMNSFTGATNNQYMPSTYVLITGDWGMTFPDSFGDTTTEGSGVAPVWTAIGTRNQALTPYLLNRDLDPTSNDSSPAFLNMAT